MIKRGKKKEQVEFKHVEIGEEGILDGETNVNKSLGCWEKQLSSGNRKVKFEFFLLISL